MKYSHLVKTFQNSFFSALLVMSLIVASFVILEPVVSRSAIEEFLVTQVISPEISFSASTTDVTMSPSISGLTGGNSTGTAEVRVTTNNSTGYTLDIVFSSTTAMNANASTDNINNFTPNATTVPQFQFEIGGTGTPAEFAYTVLSSTTDVTRFFNDNGTLCDAGTNETVNRCWMNPSTTAQEIINSSSATPAGSGATTTIRFRVAVPNSPSPTLSNDTYTATVTLTATTQ